MTAGADGRIAIWRAGKRAARHGAAKGTPRRSSRSRFRPTARWLASAAWDNTVRLWPLAGGSAARARGAHAERQRRRVHAGRQGGGERGLRSDAAHLAARRRCGDDRHAAGAALARSRSPRTARSSRRARTACCISSIATGKQTGEVQASPTPVISLAVSARRRARRRRRHPRLGRGDRAQGRASSRARWSGPGLPVWSVAFLPDNRTMLTGGTDRMVRRWDAVTGDHIGAVAMGAPEDPLAAYAGDPGAEVYPRLRRVPHALARRRQSRRPDARRDLRAQDRDAARLQFLRRAEEARHRVDAGDGREAVRGRARRLHARHQDARAAHRLGGRPQGADGFSGEGDEVV